MSDQSDHDNIVTIMNDMKWIKDWAVNHSKDDAVVAAKIETIAKAAHSRIDKTNERFNQLLTGGILSIILLVLTMFFKH